MAKLNMGGVGMGGGAGAGMGLTDSYSITPIIDDSYYGAGGPCAYQGACSIPGDVMDPCTGRCSGAGGDTVKTAYYDLLEKLGVATTSGNTGGIEYAFGGGGGSLPRSSSSSVPTWVWMLAGGAVLLTMMKR